MKTLQNKQSFTLIEFIFIILIIAVLSSIAISKISNTNISSSIITCKNDLNIINYAIKDKVQENIFKNNKTKLLTLQNDNILFSNILNNFNSQAWIKTNVNQYKYKVDNSNFLIFTFDSISNKFTCDKNKELCKKVLN